MPRPSPDLQTERLRVRPLLPEDLPDLLAVNGDPEVTRFLPYAAWAGREDAVSWHHRMEALRTAGSGVQPVIQRRAEGRVIGTVLLFKFVAPSARLELGYGLGRAHWGQGLMREALSAVIDHAFGVGGLRRIEAEVNPDNVASERLLAALGFTLEGRARQRWVGRGVAYDTHLHGLLAPEWPPSAG